ncbi:MAG: hypothetical protein V4819_01020 [Verrucomicrobiota bacterium]
METSPPSVQPPAHVAPSSPPPKKGLGTGAWIGIGCGGIVLLIVIGFIIVTVMFGGKLKKFAEDAQKNPTRATAELMVSASSGAMEMIAEDDANKRYTLKDTKSGSLITIYWDAKTNTAKNIPGDFSAVPADTATPAPESAPVPDAGK